MNEKIVVQMLKRELETAEKHKDTSEYWAGVHHGLRLSATIVSAARTPYMETDEWLAMYPPLPSFEQAVKDASNPPILEMEVDRG